MALHTEFETQSPPAKAPVVSALLCAECGYPIGEKAAGAVIDPCGHVLHVACADYIRKRAKLLSRSGDAHDLVEVVNSVEVSRHVESIVHEHEESSMQPSSSGRCPLCHESISSVVQVYLSTSGPTPPQCPVQGKCPTERLFHLQRKHLMLLKEGAALRTQFESMTRRCAALHHEHATISTRLQELNLKLPKLLLEMPQPSCEPSALSSGEKRNRIEAAVELMGEGALREYVRDVSAQAAHSEEEALKLRRSVGQLRRILESMRKRVETEKRRTNALPTVDLDCAAEDVHEHLQCPRTEGRIGGANVVDHEDVDCDDARLPVRHQYKVISVDSEESDGSESAGDDVVFISSSLPSPLEHRLVPPERKEWPRMGKSTGRFLRDLPRPVDAAWQPTLESFLVPLHSPL